MNKKAKLSAILSGLLLIFSPCCHANTLNISNNDCNNFTSETTKEKPMEIKELLNVAKSAVIASNDVYYTKNQDPHLLSTFGDINGVASGFIKYEIINKRPYIIVSFRGTDNKDDIWTDVDAFRGKKCPFLNNEVVHAGFYQRYYQCSSEMALKIVKFYNMLSKENPTILITGHSLGGALATLAALELEQTPVFKNKIQLITFCSPRVLTKGAYRVASKIFEKGSHRAIRIWRIGDTVAKVGLRSMNYKHFGESWGIDLAPGKGIANYFNIVAWHSIETMKDSIFRLQSGAISFKDYVKVNSRHAVLLGAPIRITTALGQSANNVISSLNPWSKK